jgi:hypothetical protein
MQIYTFLKKKKKQQQIELKKYKKNDGVMTIYYLKIVI